MQTEAERAEFLSARAMKARSTFCEESQGQDPRPARPSQVHTIVPEAPSNRGHLRVRTMYS